MGWVHTEIFRFNFTFQSNFLGIGLSCLFKISYRNSLNVSYNPSTSYCSTPVVTFTVYLILLLSNFVRFENLSVTSTKHIVL